LTRRAILGQAVKWSAGFGAATLTGSLLAPFMAPAAVGPYLPIGYLAHRRIFNVTLPPYGARGDGLSDDRAAIQAAIDDAARAGGGIVYLPAGNYLLNSVQRQDWTRYYLLNYFSDVALVGAGRDQTTLRAGPGMPHLTRVLSANSADGTSKVSGVLFQDFTVDGAADLQPDALGMVGISNVWTDRVTLIGMRVQKIKGTAGPEGEGVCYDSYYATNHTYRDCEAVQAGVDTTGSGFGATHAKAVSYHDCRASGSGYWMGFTVYASESVSYDGCNGSLNAQRGMNCESSQAITYLNCKAGGATGSNRGDGIYVYKSSNVDVIDCVSNGNQNGLVNSGSHVRVIRGDFSQNRFAGLAFESEIDWENTSFGELPAVSTNGMAAILIEGQPRIIEGMS
jgi:hypothetical protein